MASRSDVTGPADERSLGQLFSGLTHDMSLLLHQELELARAEITRQASQVGKDAGIIGVGGALLYAGVFGLIAALILALIHFGVTPWLAALVIGLAVAGAGLAMVQAGRARIKHDHLKPRRTVRSVKETAQWAKEQVS